MTKALTLDEARERYRWNGTDSIFEGVAVAWFSKLSGKSMVVLEDDRGLLHVYPVTERLARQEIAALSDGLPVDWLKTELENIDADIEAEPILRAHLGVLSDGDRTRAEDAQVGGDEELPPRIRVERDPNGFWSCAFAVSGSPEYIRVDLYAEALRSRDATIAGLERRLADKEADCVRLVHEKGDLFGELVAVRAQLDDDVRRLVIAARAVAFGDADEAAIRELDAASEAFADRVPWDDEPAGRAALSSLSKKG